MLVYIKFGVGLSVYQTTRALPIMTPRLLLTEKPQHVTLLFKKDSSGPQRHAKNKKNWGGSSGNWET